MDDFPTLAVPDVLAWCGERSLQMGRQYAQDGAVLRQRRQGLTLKARCQGTAPQPYAIEVTLNAKGITAARCSCPVGEGGRCKHVAAMLLNWLQRPEEFVEGEELGTALERLDKRELIALLRGLARSSPLLEERIELHIATLRGATAGEPVDTRTLRRQIQLAMEGLGRGATQRYGYDTSYEEDEDEDRAANSDAIEFVSDGFLPFFEHARQYADTGDLGNAVEVYATLATTVIQEYSPEHDYEGELMAEANAIIDECVEKLGYALETTQDVIEREVILHALFAIHDEGRASDAGDADHVQQVILDAATPEERQMVAAWVHNTMQAIGSAKDSYWHGILGRFLLLLEADALDDEAYLRMCREAGLTELLVTRLLERDRVAEVCAAVAQVEQSYQFLTLVEQVIRAGHPAEAVALVDARADKTKDSSLLRWLMERAQVEGMWDRALELAMCLFWQMPSTHGYSEVKALAERTSAWDRLHQDIIVRLEHERHFALLTDLWLMEGEPDAALAAFKNVQTRGESGYGGWGGYSGWDLRIRVAAAVEASQPDEAITLYREEVQKLIAAQGRANYATATTHLTRVRELYRRQGREREWEELIAGLREENRRLRALREELGKAGL